jgi:hypothetical protein
MRVLAIGLLLLSLGGCGGAPGETPADHDARIARMAADPDFNYLDKMNEIDATHEPPCGVCDPITPRTPDGTYTLPPQNR